jgi:hypothetical protein
MGTTRTSVLKATSAEATMTIKKFESRVIEEGPRMQSAAKPLINIAAHVAAIVERIQGLRRLGKTAIFEGPNDRRHPAAGK